MAQLPPGFVVVQPSGPTPPVAPQNLPPTPSSGPMATPPVAPQVASGNIPEGFTPVEEEVPSRPPRFQSEDRRVAGDQEKTRPGIPNGPNQI